MFGLSIAALVSSLNPFSAWLCDILARLCAFASGRAVALLCVFAPDGAHPCFNVNLCLHVGYYVLTVVGKTQTLPLCWCFDVVLDPESTRSRSVQSTRSCDYIDLPKDVST